MVTCTGHIGIHEGADGRNDVMAIKPNFLTSMGYHIFLTMVLRARAFGARGAPLLIKHSQGPVSRKSRKLFGPEKPFVKLATACFGKPFF